MNYSALPQSQADYALSIAELHTISLASLQHGENTASENLMNACRNDGIFYLDLSDTMTHNHGAVKDIYLLEKELFQLPEEVLLEYDIDRLSRKKKNGYKPLGRNRGGLVGGKDGFQSYAVPKDGIMELGDGSDFKHPQVVDQHLPALRTLAMTVATAASTIFSSVSSRLRLQPSDDLCHIHSTDQPNPDIVRLLRYPALPVSESGYSHIPHTDMGSLTFLFTEQYGLQITGSREVEWQWVRPRKGCAIVNVGDCLSFLTNKTFRSCTHRVCPLPGDISEERYSFAYLMRPNEDALMTPVKSPLVAGDQAGRREEAEILSCGEWMQRKYAMLRGDTWKEDKNWILTGATS